MAESLASKYRPKTFEDVCAQKPIIQILKTQLKNRDFKNALLFCGSSGCGKAQPLYSKVLTPQGFKLMGDINVGDSVIDGEGNITTVIGTFPQPEKHGIYEITLNDKTSFRVADNHLNSIFYYRNGKKVEEVITTTELINKFKTGIRLKINVPTIKFQPQPVTLDPYLLGVLIGDGNLNGGTCGVSLNEMDIVEKIRHICESYDAELHKVKEDGVDFRIVNKYKSKTLIGYKGNEFVGYDELHKQLQADGINIKYVDAKYIRKHLRTKDNPDGIFDYLISTPNCVKREIENLSLNTLSKHKFIPKQYLYNSIEVRLNLLRGLMDSDGYVQRTVGRNGSIGCSYWYSTSSKQLSDDFSLLVRSLGCVDVISTKIPKIKGKEYSTTYLHYIKVPNGLQIVSSKKHLDKIAPKQQLPNKKIISINYIGDEDCKCIYVNSDCHTYITDGVTVTHNTTCARIFANEINQGFGEPIEIDAASNNGVENIRTITKAANERALDGEYKIYIIDETHALTSQSWQAFLKCLEEPPKYTIFIFCTTDPQKIPETILNRVMRFNFTRIPIEQIKNRLKYICEQEHFSAQEDAIDYIARISDGGMRTAISLLDKVASYDNNITIDSTLNALGNFSYAVFLKLLLAILKKDEQQVLKIISEYYDAGNDMKLLVNQFLMFCLDVDKYLIFKSCDMTKIPATMESSLKQISSIENATKIIASYLDVLLNLKNLIKNDVSPKGSIEVTFLRMARMIK